MIRILQLVLVAVCAAGATISPAQAIDARRLPEADRMVLQAALEHDRTDQARRLPNSGATLTITRTETSPRVCRSFSIESGGQAVASTACRTGGSRWEIEASSAVAMAVPGAGAAAPSPRRKPGNAPAEKVILELPIADAFVAAVPVPKPAAEHGDQAASESITATHSGADAAFPRPRAKPALAVLPGMPDLPLPRVKPSRA
ncbi:MAG: hypothetical protein M1823_006330 [Watsoniomyces obsoletus]|nr:MAG: hypothetical protein M1823_006330 [Watsoniomyces obsoletus]